ncbi:hypothetical protein NKG94_16365 [Micromonospora sp. M12]
MTARVPEARVTAMQGPPALFEAFAQIAVANPTDDPQALARRLFGTSTAAFLACGGAPISRRVLALLAQRGIPSSRVRPEREHLGGVLERPVGSPSGERRAPVGPRRGTHRR